MWQITVTTCISCRDLPPELLLNNLHGGTITMSLLIACCFKIYCVIMNVYTSLYNRRRLGLRSFQQIIGVFFYRNSPINQIFRNIFIKVSMCFIIQADARGLNTETVKQGSEPTTSDKVCNQSSTIVSDVSRQKLVFQCNQSNNSFLM